MTARIIRGCESWFVDAELRSGNDDNLYSMLIKADRMVGEIEDRLSKMKVLRTNTQIDAFRKRLVDTHKSDKFLEALADYIITSSPEYWLANDLLYRAIIAEYKNQRHNS